ncbi:MAG: sulfotransferase domain-containing protein [Pannonibacter sp.]
MTRPPVNWLASYPKSGNTWFRFSLFYLLHERMPESSRELDAKFNSKLPVRTGEQLKKSHAKAAALATEMIDGDKIIYIVRHPLDVLQSSLNYAMLNGEVGREPDDRSAWIANYVRSAGHPPWIGAPFNSGSWNENVSGWIAQPHDRLLVIKYEDALRDTREAVATTARFLNIDTPEAVISACAEATSFDRLRSFEEKELEAARALNAPQGRFSIAPRLGAAETGIRFFNQGKAGAYRDVLSPEENHEAWSVFESAAAPLGYRLDAE